MYNSDRNPNFMRNCKAAYLTVKNSTEEALSTREEFLAALQQSGRNPTKRFIDKYWRANTYEITFQDYCRIQQDEPETTESDLKSAFRKIDANGDGFIAFSELKRMLQHQKERLSDHEMRQVFTDIDLNRDGKIDYNEFVHMVQRTAEETRKANIKRLERLERPKRQKKAADRRDRTLEHQKRGSIDSLTPRQKPPSNDSDSVRSHLSNRSGSPLKPSSHRSSLAEPAPIRSPTSSGNSSARSPRRAKTLTMPAPESICKPFLDSRKLQRWNVIKRKGCFYYDENSRGQPAIVGHRYTLKLNQADSVLFCIQPTINSDMPTSSASDTCPTDTVLFVLESTSKKVVCCTPDRDTQGCFHTQQVLEAGEYVLLPFTTGCRFRPRPENTQASSKADLLEGTGNDIKLSKRFRMVLMNIFDTFDLDDNGSLNREEFNLYNLRTGDESVTDEEWEVVKTNFDTRGGELTMKGFTQLHELEAKDANGDTEDMWLSLQQVGYDHNLIMNEACSFELCVYTEDTECWLGVGQITALQQDWEFGSVVGHLWKQSEILYREHDLTMRYWSNGFWAVLLASSEANNQTVCQVEISRSKNSVFTSLETLTHLTVEPFKPKVVFYGSSKAENAAWLLAVEIKR